MKIRSALFTCFHLVEKLDVEVKVLTDLTVQELPDTTAGDPRMYLNAIDFEFLLRLVIATTVFDVTALSSD